MDYANARTVFAEASGAKPNLTIPAPGAGKRIVIVWAALAIGASGQNAIDFKKTDGAGALFASIPSLGTAGNVDGRACTIVADENTAVYVEADQSVTGPNRLTITYEIRQS